ncbi:MAG: thiamine phosphate synthase [Gemmatimonadota bacterium]|jgi:thiamine-phosphate diphosphorylase|nr:thiamine phosphate synthase [Gemmatimonadota bacterium]
MNLPLNQLLALTVITDPAAWTGPAVAAIAALRGGARTIQVRWKGGSTREILSLVQELREPTRAIGALLIVNDRLDIALAAGADGVHLGDEDLPIAIARQIAPAGFIIGGSVDTPEEAAAAERAGASYVGFGPIHPTGTKSNTGSVTGEQMLTEVKRAISIPLVAIGGMNRENAASAVRTGADGVAVVGAVAFQVDPEAAAAGILAEVIRDREGISVTLSGHPRQSP